MEEQLPFFRSNGLLTAVKFALNPESCPGPGTLGNDAISNFSGFNANSTTVNNPCERNSETAPPQFSSAEIPTKTIRKGHESQHGYYLHAADSMMGSEEEEV